jgi:hypothetical protein
MRVMMFLTRMTQFLNNSVPQFFSDPLLLSLFRSLLYIYKLYIYIIIYNIYQFKATLNYKGYIPPRKKLRN